MTVLYIICSVLALFVLILISSVRVSIKYDGKFKINVWFWCFGMRLLPKKEKKKKSEKEDVEKENKLNFKRNAKEDGMASAISEILDFTGPILNRLNILLAHVRIKPFVLKLGIGGDDAAIAAIEYGAVSAVLYPFIGLLATKTKFPKREIEMSLISDGENEAYFYCRVKLRIIHAIIAAVAVFFGYIENNKIKDGALK